jgi:hypothetical protein
MDRLSLKWLLERKSSADGAAKTADWTQQGDSVAMVRRNLPIGSFKMLLVCRIA